MKIKDSFKKDITNSTEENFNAAYDLAVSRLGLLTEI